MAEKKATPAMEFVMAQLRKDPKVPYADVKEGAAKKGLEIYPIVYGRAKALLGLVPTSPRGQGKNRKKAEARRGRPAGSTNQRRGPGRPRKDAGSLDSLDSLIGAVKDDQRERERYRRALEQIRSILEGLAAR